MKNICIVATIAGLFLSISGLRADTILVEAESFENQGGWKLDTQFIEIMGSPYLMAHGMGKPVANAETTVKFPAAGTYKMWVRTKDWVAQWKAAGAPGKFEVMVNGKAVGEKFGTKGADWHWQEGGEVEIASTEVKLALHDLTGFNGRCDAIIFSNETGFVPDNSSDILPAWRRELAGISAEPIEQGPYDIVFIGGGFAGNAGAISAARMGLKVALVQNRGVLGGNGSSEVRVWAMGNTPPGLYPVGDIVRELDDDASASPAPAEEFEDDKKLEITEAEKNLDLFLWHHGYEVEMESETKIRAVLAFDTRTGAIRRFTARNFCDTTGHGYIGMKANADREMIDAGRMGMSNMWSWANTDADTTFPETPWALDLAEGDFPYPQKFHAQWFWESGYDKHPLNDLESIRDWNLRASFGAWNALKNKGAYDRYDKTGNAHKTSEMTWIAYIGGTRETQQLLGDVILTEEDIVSKKPFNDGCVLTTWSVDLHYPKEQYAKKFPDNPFISYAQHGKGVDRKKGYPVPYRCFYSRNIENLFMAGRNVSVTHKALGTVRVMKTCGMMGVVVGKAAALCTEHDVTPREVYYQHLDELVELMRLPGNMRRASISDEFAEDPNLPKFEPEVTGYIPLSKITGIVIDDDAAKLTGKWAQGAGLKNHIENGYRYASAGSGATATFEFEVPADGDYEVRVASLPHENRSTKTPVTIKSANGEKTVILNQRVAPPLQHSFYTVGVHTFKKGTPGQVVITTEGIDGNVHIDAVQVLKQK